MTAALHLARPGDMDRLLSMIERFCTELEMPFDPDARRAGLIPLLEGSPLGAAYLIGPARAPVGYLLVTFAWSVDTGQMTAFMDELFIRPAVRRRGMASEVLDTLPRALAQAGVATMYLEVDRTDTDAQRLYQKAGFNADTQYMLMMRST